MDVEDLLKVTEKVCETCGKPYTRRERNHKWFVTSRFCSIACRDARKPTGEASPVWKERIRMFCKNCGVEIVFPKHYRPYQIITRKFCSYKCRSGVHHKNWAGGHYKVGKGYMKSNTGVGENQYTHRVIAEKALGRPLKRDETVHHVNLDKTKNENANLLICSNSYHQWIHQEMARRYAEEHFDTRVPSDGLLAYLSLCN